MEIEINGQKKELKELKYLDAVEVEEIRTRDGLKAATKKMLLCLGLSEEEADNLSMEDGIKINSLITKVSENFQNPTEQES